MLGKEYYSNGQRVFELGDDRLTYFYKNGNLKATGPFINGQMHGEWTFYRNSGQLWQVANFKTGMKHGSWVRYGKDNKIEYNEEFANDEPVKRN